jgi:thiamine transporter ThiT
MKPSQFRKLVVSAMFVTLCAVLPLTLHMIPNAGSVISPMHIPVLLCGLICGWQFGLATGILGPMLSSFTTGMPNPAYLPSMIVELAVYGAVTGLLYKYLRTKNKYVDLYISLITAMLLGRVLAGLTRAFIFTQSGYSFAIWAGSYFITSLPGIAIHLTLIPIILIALEAAKLTPKRY